MQLQPKKLLILTLLVLVTLAFVAGAALVQDDPNPHDENAEWQVLTELNTWRIRRGLAPLVRNRDLDALAAQQAVFMVARVPFTGIADFHTDEFGDGVFRRAELAGWPGYDAPDRVLISEIAAYYPDVAGAINFWKNSPVHARSVQTAGYREAGVVVLKNKNWLLSYVILGGRPNVLPVTYDPYRNVLFLSRDESVFTDGFAPTRVRILNDQGQPLHSDDWLVWSNKITLPRNATGVIKVIVTDGITFIETEVDLYASRVFPSQPTPTPTITFTPAPSSTPILQTATLIPPTIAPSATPAALNDKFDIRMVYDTESWTLINQSGHAVDLEPLTVVSNAVGFRKTGSWFGEYYEGSINAVPTSYCFQAWSFEIFYGPPDLPRGCTMMASGRSKISAGQRFWLAQTFDIYYRTQHLAQCRANAGVCEFDMPE